MGWQHTVFAVIPAKLGKKGHRLLGALGDQLAVHPVHRVGESGSLAVHFRRKQVAHRDVEGEPVGVEPVDQLAVESVAQNLQRISVFQAHGRRF